MNKILQAWCVTVFLVCIGVLSSCIGNQKKEGGDAQGYVKEIIFDGDLCFLVKKNNDSISAFDFANPETKKSLIELLFAIQKRGQGHNFTLQMSNSEKPLQFCMKKYQSGKLDSVESQECSFCAIGRGEKPQQKIDENALVVAFEKIPKRTPVNFLITPKAHIKDLNKLEVKNNSKHREIWIAMLAMAQKLSQQAKKRGYSGIFTLRIHTGPNAFQSVPHLHMHVKSEDAKWY